MANVVTQPTMMPTDTLLVQLQRANFNAELRMPRGAERKTAVWNRAVDHAQQTQAPLVALADQLKASGAIAGYEQLVAPNALLVDPAAGKGRTVLEQFGTAPGVKAVYDMSGKELYRSGAPADAQDGAGLVGGRGWGLDLYSRGPAEVGLHTDGETPWGIGMIGAPEANAAGADGSGLVYGSIDTGADFTHEAIAAKYRGAGTDGSATHDYNWFDFGSGRSSKPVDPDAHGTHTIGTVVGGTDTMHIGVAPKAKWISVAGLKGGVDVRLKSLQFMQAPTKLDGTDPNPALAPDVVGMSWWTGPKDTELFRDSIDMLVAAGIEPVKSAGNNGPGPESGSSPSQYPSINAVAAVDETGQVADFSSRGPSGLPHTGQTPGWKPDFAAPGVAVLSSVPGNKYAKYSGTSMAQPHFSGALLALMTKFPKLTHDQITTVLKESATDAGARGRDLEFGYGIINVARALEVAAARFPGAAA